MKGCCQVTQQATHNRTLKIALAGNPNCGKTTVFNALTGTCQRVGNWPGVTVEHKSGYFSHASKSIEVVDLPGVYALTPAANTALDECVACEFLLQQPVDVVVNIIDASNIERHLYLTLQLLEMGVPVILALNMMDVARQRGVQLDIAKLTAELGCPAVMLEAANGAGIAALKQAVIEYGKTPVVAKHLAYPAIMQEAVEVIATKLPHYNRWLAISLLENEVTDQTAFATTIKEQQVRITQALGEDPDILFAETRYQLISSIVTRCVSQATVTKPSWTTRIDKLVLNRFAGIPIFLAVMYCLFVFAINIGGAFQDFFDISSQTIFVDGPAYILTQIGAPAWLIALLANGVGKGINTTVTFIPVLGGLFLFLSFLEDSGYMVRAAFIADRFMQILGLPGKAFVPMIVGFGCNVPAVLSARTLENKRDRILTIMMSPFMSCGARLAIFAVFTAAFFPHHGQNIVFALYVTGVAMAVLTGFILRNTVLQGKPSPLVMELPVYHMPRFKTLFIHTWQRLQGFVVRAGILIVPISVLIGALNAMNIHGGLNPGDAHSLLAVIGKSVTPIFAPMGIQADNWPATIGLVTGILAKEVVIGTLNTLYTQIGHFTATAGAGTFHFWESLTTAFYTIPHNLANLGYAFRHPFTAQAPFTAVNQGVYGLMGKQFDGRVGAFAYLLFVLLYFPCVSTLAAMLRELHRGWSWFSACWMTSVAYGTAVTFYQAATWARHPVSSSVWIAGVVTAFIGTLIAIRLYANRQSSSIEYPLVTVTGGPV